MALDLKQEAILELDQLISDLESIEMRQRLVNRQKFENKSLINSVFIEAFNSESNQPSRSSIQNLQAEDTKNTPYSSLVSDFEKTDYQTKSFLIRFFGKSSHEYLEYTNKNSNSTKIGFLSGIRDDLAKNRFNFREIASAEIFTDFLEMAEHLLDEGYKDPAAVLIGGVLEEHLRKLCIKNSLPIKNLKNGKMVATSSDTLNADLAKAAIYGKLDQKNITAWLDLRNKAAHGHYSEYTKEQVVLFLQSVQDFITRHTA